MITAVRASKQIDERKIWTREEKIGKERKRPGGMWGNHLYLAVTCKRDSMSTIGTQKQRGRCQSRTGQEQGGANGGKGKGRTVAHVVTLVAVKM